MEKIIVEGGYPLYGGVAVSGMKNSALPIIYATILIKDECVIHNVPRVSDVYDSLEILRLMGAVAEFCDTNTVRINCTNIDECGIPERLVSKMRASSYLMGAMLSRFGRISLPLPGGCNFGARPLDLHFKGFEVLGAKCVEEDGIINIFAKERLKSHKITLDKISVGATINMVLASTTLDGTTVIANCASEPHVDDVISFLNACGASIVRDGGVITCNGVKRLHGVEYTIFPDMIEALTYACAVGICTGEIEIYGVVPSHLSCGLSVLKTMGCEIKEYEKVVAIKAKKVFGTSVTTAPFPCFPTDLHPQLAALLCFAKDGGTITEGVFPTRFAYVKELTKMGADIYVCGNSVHVGESQLNAACLDATDLRAGAALTLASLGARGVSTINNVNYIVRGYEDFVFKLANIGGKIKLI